MNSTVQAPTRNMDIELQLLNAATDREYTIRKDGTQYTLTTQQGGKYPPLSELAQREQLMRLTISANGRGSH